MYSDQENVCDGGLCDSGANCNSNYCLDGLCAESVTDPRNSTMIPWLIASVSILSIVIVALVAIFCIRRKRKRNHELRDALHRNYMQGDTTDGLFDVHESNVRYIKPPTPTVSQNTEVVTSQMAPDKDY